MDKVSIVITSYKRKDFSINLIDSIQKNTTHNNIEIISVNTYPKCNRYLDVALEKLKDRGKIKLVNTGERMQYTEGLQAGYEVADGKYILLLNDDVLIPPTSKNWITCLQNRLESDPKAGTVAAFQYLNGKMLYTAGEHDIKKPGHTCGSVGKLEDQPAEQNVLWNPFSYVMLRKEFVDKFQFTDVIPPPQYHYGSDSCYCRKVMKEGYNNVLINKSWIFHFNNRTMKARMYRYVYNGI